jgi:hypothetical protein
MLIDCARGRWSVAMVKAPLPMKQRRKNHRRSTARSSFRKPVGLAGATRAGVHARVWMGGSHSRPGKSPTVFVAAVVVQAQSPRTRAPLRPSGGRGRGPTPTGPRRARPEDRLRVGRVRWAASQIGSSALPPERPAGPAVRGLPSPPGQRLERVKGASSEPRFGGKSSKSRSYPFPRQPCACGGRLG